MKKEPIVVVMAAGMGSRYGGLKQIDPVGDHGEILMDYALYDAKRAGFQRVVFIIKPEMEAEFHEIIGRRMEKQMEVSYAFQKIDSLPQGISIPEGRTKPWGTGHAVLSCSGVVDAPFAVINADDFYGQESFDRIYRFLCEEQEENALHFAMVGYILANTLTENGHVARGICEVKEGFLTNITERTRIEKHDTAVEYTEDGESWNTLDPQSIVSMNLWGFTPVMLEKLNEHFADFLIGALRTNPLKAEYFLPSVVNELLKSREASVRVLTSRDKWYGMTYHEDKPRVCAAIQEMIRAGKYPENLWNRQEEEV